MIARLSATGALVIALLMPWVVQAPSQAGCVDEQVVVTAGPDTATTSTTFPPGSRISGMRLLLKTGRKSLVLVSNDSGIMFGSPIEDGGTLRIFTADGDGFDDTYSLPAAGWKPLDIAGVPGFRFKARRGPIKLLIIRLETRLRVVGSGKRLMHSLRRDPRPVMVDLRVGDTRPFLGPGGVVLSFRLCLSFGGTVRFTPGKRFLATDAPAPATCPPYTGTSNR